MGKPRKKAPAQTEKTIAELTAAAESTTLKRYEEKTLSNYRSKVKMFKEFCSGIKLDDGQPVDVDKVDEQTPQIIRMYLVHKLEDHGQAVSG
jgi:hypothetical protein